MVGTRIDAERQELHLTVTNHGRTALTFTLAPLAYTDTTPRTVKVKAGGSRTVAHPAAAAHGWYDLGLRVAEDRSFHRRIDGACGERQGVGHRLRRGVRGGAGGGGDEFPIPVSLWGSPQTGQRIFSA